MLPPGLAVVPPEEPHAATKTAVATAMTKARIRMVAGAYTTLPQKGHDRATEAG